MFEPQVFSPTPANARRLLEFSRLKGTAATDDITDLAACDTVAIRLADNGLVLSDAEQIAMQRVLDWDGRGMLLVNSMASGWDFATALCKLRDSKKVLVLATPALFGPWARQFEKELPGLRISVCGNPRHKNLSNLPKHIKFNDTPDATADVIITNYLGVIWHDLLDAWIPEQTIVEEFSAAGAGMASHKHTEILAALFREIPSPLFIQNISGYPSDRDLFTVDYKGGSKQLSWDIQELLDWGVWASCGFPGKALLQRSPAAVKTMQMRGYAATDTWSLLPLLGISAELIRPANQ